MPNYRYLLRCTGCNRTSSKDFKNVTEASIQQRVLRGKQLLRHPRYLICPGCRGIMSVGIQVQQIA